VVTTDGFSDAVGGLALRLSTSAAVYRSGEPIALSVSLRSSADHAFAIWADATRNVGEEAPLYALYALTLVKATAAEGSGEAHRRVLRAIPSQRFLLAKLERLDPGAVRTSTARLTTWAWACDGEQAAAPRPVLALDPGAYTLTGSYLGPGDAGPTVEEVEAAERFLSGSAPTLAEFQRARLLGLSYRDGELLRSCGFRLWRGELSSPEVRFEVR
jgi:hypothetical protein